MLQPKKSFWGTRPGFDLGDILHILVNVGFVAVIYAMVVFWNLAPLAAVLVVLSKWRVLAVQPRFWLPNIKANLVDLTVGISTIILTFQAPHQWIAIFWMLLYVVWLLLLKPQTQDVWVGLQAFWAQLLGITAILTVPSLLRYPLLICLLVWVIAWSSARHYFSNYEEAHYRSLGLVWGFIATQLVWIGLHWLQYYVIFDIKIAVIGVVMGIITASMGGVYHAHKRGTLERVVLMENGLFAAALLTIVLLTAHWVARL